MQLSSASSLTSSTSTTSTSNEMQKESQVVEIRPDDIVLEQEIGRGSFAKVYRGKCRGQTVAIKVLHTQTFTEQILQAFREEIAVMSQIHHPNLVLFMGACTIPGKLMIVTELMPRNLETVFLDKISKGKRIPLVQKIKMAKDAALGMNWLHKSTPMFIHRDFKLSNLLVDENFNVKVCDFGLTKMKQANDNLTDTKGSPLYMAPEVYTGSYSEKCDVYSFGLSFWEIINERRVFPRYENNIEALIKSRCENYETPPLTDDMLPRLGTLLERCWDKNPKSRPSFDVVVKELEEILIEQCITDEKGREMWKKASKNEDKLQWDELARAVCIAVNKIAIPESYRSDRQMRCLKVLLCRQSDPNTVHAEKFGKVLSWFGPFIDDKGARDSQNRFRSFLDRIEETLSQRWFHGDLSTQEAEERLDNQKGGTFLVRFSSSEKGGFTVSGIDKDRTKSHQRIIYHPNRGLYVLARDDTVYTSLTDALSDICRSSRLRLPCPGSRYSKYFSEEAALPTAKNIMLIKEEIKQLQLMHLLEICEQPPQDASSLDATIDSVAWAREHHTSLFMSGRSPYHGGNSSIHSTGAWAGGGGRGGDGGDGANSIRIAPYIPPPERTAAGGGLGGQTPQGAPPGSRHLSGPAPSLSDQSLSGNSAAAAAAKAKTASSNNAAAAMAYRQSPYTQTKYPSLTYSPHPHNSADLYYSAPMTSMKSTSSSSFSFAQFTSTKHPFRSKDILTAPLKSAEEKKKGSIFSRLKRGVTGGGKDKHDKHDGYYDGKYFGDRDDRGDVDSDGSWSGKSGKHLVSKSAKKLGSGNNNSGGSSKKDAKKNNGSFGKGKHHLGHHHGKDRDRNKKDFPFSSDPGDPFPFRSGGHHHRNDGGGTSDEDSANVYNSPSSYARPMATDSTTASTNSIPAHVLLGLQKADAERHQRRINGNYDSDSSTEDLYPPYQPSAATSTSSSYIKRTLEDGRPRLGHLVGHAGTVAGGKEMLEMQQQQDDDEEEEVEADDHRIADNEDDSDSDDDDDDDEEEERERKEVESESVDEEEEEDMDDEKERKSKTKKKKKKKKQVAKLLRARESGPSMAATAPPGLLEAAMLSIPRARRERAHKQERSARKHSSSPTTVAFAVDSTENGTVADFGSEEGGLRLDQLPRTSTSPSTSPPFNAGGGLGVGVDKQHRKSKEKKEKKGRHRGGGGGGESTTSTGDEDETGANGHNKTAKEKKEKGGAAKGKKAKKEKGVEEALQRRQSTASSTTEDETSEKEKNDTQGRKKKKKKKDDERTVIAVF